MPKSGVESTSIFVVVSKFTKIISDELNLYYLLQSKRDLFVRKERNYMKSNNVSLLFTLVTFLLTLLSGLSVKAQTFDIILGRPTDISITASIMFNENCDFYLEFGNLSGSYPFASTQTNAISQIPEEVEINNLSADTRYFYRLRYRQVGNTNFLASPEYSFHTQRSPGQPFTFTIEADEHLYDKKGIASMYRVTLANQASDQPDFMLSLGDIFGDDHEPFTITSGALDSLHRNYRPFLGEICHSVPFYICLGNHEGENDYYYGFNPPNNLCVWGTTWRKFYFPNPYPNQFYSGNTDNEPYGIGNPENYYSWTWGDALFVVLDVYRDQCDTSARPGGWNWTLGLPQYNWLKNTLENSQSKYKFVFAHHIRGQGRGGITNAKLFEWGGFDGPNGSSYSFTNKRPGWDKPIHQLFKDNGVNIFFQGHDHVFAHEVLDSIVYQAVPMAADSTYEIGMLANASAYISDTVDGTGHLRVMVSSECVKVDYIKAYLPADTISGIHHNGEVGFSYTLGTCSTEGLLKLHEENEIKIYPNPANERVRILDQKNEKIIKIIVTDSHGNLIMQTNSRELQTSQLSPGIYYLQVITEKNISTEKLLIQH